VNRLHLYSDWSSGIVLRFYSIELSRVLLLYEYI
jgi:hypothetical protein